MALPALGLRTLDSQWKRRFAHPPERTLDGAQSDHTVLPGEELEPVARVPGGAPRDGEQHEQHKHKEAKVNDLKKET